MQNIPNGGRPLRFIRLVKPTPPPQPLPKPIESYQEVTIPEFPCDKK